jgi:hypothetical protein
MAVINFSSKLSDTTVQEAIRAVNRQVVEDFMPIWGAGYSLKLHAAAFDPGDEASLQEEEVRADSVMYLVDEATVAGALGFHSLNTSGIPFGFVFTVFEQDWTITLSHEVLELIIDPTANVLVPGPDPRNPANFVLHSYEVCDAVERTSYQIDGISVSNFITPAYFSVGDELGTRNDFLGVGVTSFGATQGSHLAFFDLAANEWVTILGQSQPNTARLAKRQAAYASEKPPRPAEETLDAILSKCHAKNVAKPVKGITRTARYRQAVHRLMNCRTAA